MEKHAHFMRSVQRELLSEANCGDSFLSQEKHPKKAGLRQHAEFHGSHWVCLK